MKLAALGAALAFSLVGGVRAEAQNWTYVAATNENVQYNLDTASVRQHGKYVESWQKQVLPRPARLDDGKPYVFVLAHRLDDCAAGTTAELDIVFNDAKGASVKTFNIPEANVQFRATPPGSVGQAMQAQVCAHARRLAALKPLLSLDLFTGEEWISLGANPSFSETNLARKSIQRDGAKAVYATRSQTNAPMKTINGAIYRTTYQLWQMDCDLSTARNLTGDYYDETNRLVDVSQADDLSTLAFVPINPGSTLEAARKIVCATQTAQGGDAQKDEPRMASGTGWMGPKGYIITASHVVEGSRAIVLAQDGKPVGTAEVVVSDPSNDVAILKPRFDAGVHPVIPLAAEPAELGEHVFTLGYPAPTDLGLSVKMTSGEISGLKGSDLGSGRIDDARLLQTSVPVQHGNSGGPLLDDHGQAVGVIVTRFTGDADDPLQNVNYAVKVTYVRSLLSELPDLGGYRPLKVSNTTPGLIADLRNSVFMLVVASGEDK
jgi:S1-C subfamily serine protease